MKAQCGQLQKNGPMNSTLVTTQEIALRNRAFRAVAPLSDADLSALPPPLRVTVPAGGVFLRAGESAHRTGLVVDGALREYFVLADGSERTKGFNLPGEFAGSLSDLLSGEPSRVWIAAERSTTLLVTPWQAYLDLIEKHPAWSTFARLIAERLYRAKAQREYELLALDAATRYQLALERWPDLESYFTQRAIASYIGITPVHLSRLRRNQGKSVPAARTNPAPPQRKRGRKASR